MANAVKHAAATVVHVEVGLGPDVLRVRIRDDGKGGATVDGGSGLRGLGDRIEALGGSLAIDSPADAGTTLTAEIPVSGS
jgi:signal transduction histidine kinase